MLIRNTQLNGRRIDLRCEQGLISELGDTLVSRPGEIQIDARGGALLPGLHDHHIHLHAHAAADSSLVCGPPGVTNTGQLRQLLQEDGGSGWIRGIAYHELVAGELDRWSLDKLVSDRPLRIQHRSGKLWVVNSLAVQILELEKYSAMEGVGCDQSGCPNGRLFRLDEWLGEKLGSRKPPDVKRVSVQLASYGLTGITDATPGNSVEAMRLFGAAIDDNRLLQRVLLMGDQTLPVSNHSRLQQGALKLLLDDCQLPDTDEFVEKIVAAHRGKRAVAIHCVTTTELVFALSCIIAAGCFPGDRVEHASVVPDELLPLLREANVSVVTQHGFIRERGDRYLMDVELRDHPLLYRGKAFLDAGIPLAGSSDAPYGGCDPWLTMRTAVDRTTDRGTLIGAEEKLTPEQALALFTGCANYPGTGIREIAIGATADLCVLDCSWSRARTRLQSRDVLATIRGGELIYSRACRT